MSWNDAMRRVLPPIWDIQHKRYVPSHETSGFGRRMLNGKREDHGGRDFNYFGGQTSPFYQSHPALHSPVTGVVTNAGEGTVGKISIRDANGLTHELLHTHAQHVSKGDPVVAGQLIGTMGNTGVKPKRDGKPGDQHVHYQLRDPNGNIIDPGTYWDQQGPVDPCPAPPSHLDDYQRYLATPGAVMSDVSPGIPKAGPLYGQQPSMQPPNTAAARGMKKQTRVLSAKYPRADLRGYDANAPTTVPDELPSSNAPSSFGDRFGNSSSSHSATAPLSPYQPVVPPPQAGRPLGIIDGQPMSDVPFSAIAV